MTIHSLRDRKIQRDMAAVQDEITQHLVEVDRQHRAWEVGNALKNLPFSARQVRRLAFLLMARGGVTLRHIETAVAMTGRCDQSGCNNVLELRGVEAEAFWRLEERIEALGLEYRQALDLLLILVGRYPWIIGVVG